LTDRVAFEFSNLSDRPPGRFLGLAALLVPGVRAVQAQVEPYAAAWREHNIAALDGTGPLWVALGDSMTQGIGAGSHDRGWVGQLAARMPGWRVVNLGISGGRVRDVLDRQLPALDSLGVLPDLVTLLIGNNDMVNPKLRPHLGTDLPELLRRVPPGTVVGNQPGTYAAALEVNRMIDDAVAERALVLADLRDPRTRHWGGRLAADHFHPNERGYAGIADVFDDAVRRRPRTQ
jgi:lysophospholipase L1-like esterase